LIEHQVEEARRRSASGAFVNRAGETLCPTFHCQSIAVTLRDATGPLADHSVDLAVSGGVVGLYLTEEQGRALLAELKRIIRPGGFIALDADPPSPNRGCANWPNKPGSCSATGSKVLSSNRVRNWCSSNRPETLKHSHPSRVRRVADGGKFFFQTRAEALRTMA